ncbi:MAG: ATP-binding protein [Anaerolineales bacterium]
MSDCVHPCPCGYYGDSQKPCTCAHALVTKYQKRISGPLLDRIDTAQPHRSAAPGLRKAERRSNGGDQCSNSGASPGCSKYSAIPLYQLPNYQSTDIICNADMRVGEIRQFCRLQDEGQSLMRAAMAQLNLSARAYHRILKLARTIADLAGCEEIQSVHLAEALQYRPKIMM